MAFQDTIAPPKTRVLVVDDTKTIRAMIRAFLADDPRIEVVGEAGDPYEARALIKALQPDVLTLDVEMPRMNGLVFLEKLMRLRPTPVVMVSTRTAEQSDEAVRALALGAFDCIDLIRLRNRDPRLPDLADTLVAASRSKLGLSAKGRVQAVTPAKRTAFDWNGRIVLVGSSTGGVDALLTIVGDLDENCAPVVIAQHMPSHFLRSFANRLNTQSAAKVSIAEDGHVLRQGEVLLAPGGDFHAEVAGKSRPRIRLCRDRGDQLYSPSVNLLFGSALPIADRTVAVMLTGMGKDGAQEMRHLFDGGAVTIAQSAETCVVDGMPRSAREAGAVAEVVDLGDISARVRWHTNRLCTAGP